MKKLLLFFFSIYLFVNSMAQIAGPQSGKSFGNASLNGSDQSWINRTNAGATDNQYTTFGNLPDVAGSHTDYLVVADFGFSIPAGFQIRGIVAYIESSDLSGSTADYNIRIMKGGVVGTAERSSGALYSDGSSSYRIYGGANDLWGETWTPENIKANDFGIAVAAQRAVTGKPTEGRIDNIRIAVYYIDPASLPFTTLPLNLTAFSAIPKKDMVRLEWKTTDESGMDRFEIQRSSDGTDFKSFGTLMCRNQVTPASYAFTDYAPFRGTSSYRLKILEKSGAIIYSKVVMVQFKTDNAATLYPSPWKKGQSLFIRNPHNEKLMIKFFDDTGEIAAKVSTVSGQVAMPPLTNVKGILRYKVFDEKEKLAGSGSLLVY